MRTLVIDIKSDKKAKELSLLLAEIKFVKRVSIIRKKKKVDALLKSKHRLPKKKRSSKESLLSQIEAGLKDVSNIQSGKTPVKTLKEILNGK